VSQNGWLLSRRGRSSPANASGFDSRRDSISSRFDRRDGAGAGPEDGGVLSMVLERRVDDRPLFHD
jgi:hypothetical protein